MSFAIAVLSVVPMRIQPNHRSEQVSQLLFGETCAVSEESKEWVKITGTHDAYGGWVLKTQLKDIAPKEYALANESNGVAIDVASSANSSENNITVLIGSSLPQFDGINFKIGKEKFIYTGQSLQTELQNFSLIEKIAVKFLNAPYLWGGRTPFGIDCSGFTQVVFKCVGIQLRRDAWQQAEDGQIIDFVESARMGDLAFFHNDDGKIVHVGIILRDSKIIHASGKVRIDTLDHFGIFNVESKKYSHQLKIIKRYI